MPTLPRNYLDVTLLEPVQKHPTIFKRFDSLAGGESLVIHSDHDPKPLYYQLLAERGNVFEWECLEEGPMDWAVRIGKNLPGMIEETLGQVATKDLRKADIFKKYGLDFCCGGKRTVKEACMEKGLDFTMIEQELRQVEKSPISLSQAFNEWSLDFLADYIVNTHHRYVKKMVPELRTYAAKVAKAHGDHRPELLSICNIVDKVAEEMFSHMEKEERILFPFIKQLCISDEMGQLTSQLFGTVQHPIKMMEEEHEMAGSDMDEIRALSNNYTIPADACASYTLFFHMLEEFENDLHIHVHLENNILFPKSIALEKKLNDGNAKTN